MTGGVYREGLEGLRAQIAERRAVAAEAFARVQALAPFPWVLLGEKTKDEIAEGDADASAIVVEAHTETDPGKLVTKLQELDVIVDDFDSMRSRTLSLLEEMGELVPDDMPGTKIASIDDEVVALRKMFGSAVSSAGSVARAKLEVVGHPIHLLAARCHALVADNSPLSLFEQDGPVWPYHSLVAAVPIRLPKVHVYVHEAIAIVISMFAKPVVPHEPLFHRHFSVRGNLDVARAILRPDVCRTLTQRLDAKPQIRLEQGRLLVSWLEGVAHVPAMITLLGQCLEALMPR